MAKANKTFWVGALIGGVLGSVSALLLAPKSGRELRQDIAEGAQQVSEKTQHLAKQFGDHSGELLTTAKEKVVAIKQGWSEWRQDGAEEEEKVMVTAVKEITAEQVADSLAEQHEDNLSGQTNENVSHSEESVSQAETEHELIHQS